MRSKQIKLGNKNIDAILMAGGKGFKIYSIPNAILLQLGKTKFVFMDSDSNYNIISKYCSLKYQSNKEKIKEQFDNLLTSLNIIRNGGAR